MPPSAHFFLHLPPKLSVRLAVPHLARAIAWRLAEAGLAEAGLTEPATSGQSTISSFLNRSGKNSNFDALPLPIVTTTRRRFNEFCQIRTKALYSRQGWGVVV